MWFGATSAPRQCARDRSRCCRTAGAYPVSGEPECILWCRVRVVGASGATSLRSPTWRWCWWGRAAIVGGERMSGAEALAKVGFEPLHLGAKEGLALINGTQASAAVGALAVADARRLFDAADVICALTLDAMAGTDAAFDPAVHAARPHPGQVASADRLLTLLVGSEIRESHRECGRVQDAYSLRCSPQVHGAGRDALEHAHRVLTIELNSATDNPHGFCRGAVDLRWQLPRSADRRGLRLSDGHPHRPRLDL